MHEIFYHNSQHSFATKSRTVQRLLAAPVAAFANAARTPSGTQRPRARAAGRARRARADRPRLRHTRWVDEHELSMIRP
eukprot:4327981-Prymnesium_polylepis.1